jgi:hypothetical protein
MIQRTLVLLVGVFLAASFSFGQSRTGSVQGMVTDPSDSAIIGAIVTLIQPITGYKQTVSTDQNGSFRLLDVPFNSYTLHVESPGFSIQEQTIELRSTVPVMANLRLQLAAVTQEVAVVETPELLDAGRIETSTVIDQSVIARQPGAAPSRGIENLVLAQPGFIAEDNGRIHVRGSESQIQYVVDGIPITDNLSAIFSSSLDARTLRSVEVITGSIPPEFGKKLAGVVNVTTKSGRELPNSGSLTFSAGSFSTGEAAADFALHNTSRRVGLYGNVSGSTSRRFLDPPLIDNFQNRGRTVKSLFRIDYEITPTDSVRGSFSFGGTNFQVPNRLDQQVAGQRQRQVLRDNSESVSYQRILSGTATATFSFYHRFNNSTLLSNGSAIPVVPFQERYTRSIGGVAAIAMSFRRHDVKMGFEATGIPVREQFRFYVTDASVFDPFEYQSARIIPNPALKFTQSNPFAFDDSRTGRELSGYVQDRFHATENLAIDFGVRFDDYRVVTSAHQFAPRVGLAYYLPHSKTILRASYNRLFMTPSIENLLLASSPQAGQVSPLAALQGAAGVQPIRPETQNVFEGGLEQQLSRFARFSVTAYNKQIRNFADKDQFLDTGVIFPITLFAGRVTGYEGRLDLASFQGLHGYVSYANSRAFGITPVTGGLFLTGSADTLKQPALRFPNDHDQRTSGQFRLIYSRDHGGWWAAIGARYDSGLPLIVSGDRAFFEAQSISPRILDQVDFDRGRVSPRTLWDCSAGIDFHSNNQVQAGFQFDVQNLTNRFFVYNFESIFSGTHVGYPRLFSGRMVLKF